MTIPELQNDQTFVQSWKEKLASDEAIKLMLQALYESSPINTLPTEANNDALRFAQGYNSCINDIKTLGTGVKIKQYVKATYGVKQNAN